MILDFLLNETGYTLLKNHILVGDAALSTVLLNHPMNHDKSTAICTRNLPYNKSDALRSR